MPPPPVTLTFDLESGVRVVCDVGYLCVNFNLPRPLFPTQARCTRQTDVRQHHRLMPPPRGKGKLCHTPTGYRRGAHLPF